MVEIELLDESKGVGSPEEKVAALSAITMVLEEEIKGRVVQKVWLRDFMDKVEGIGSIRGHMDPETGLITLNMGALTGLDEPVVFSETERKMRIITTAAHEAKHAVQRLIGHVLPDDETCRDEQYMDPWYEVEARKTSLEVLKAVYPRARGELPMGPNGVMYPVPLTSRYQKAWDKIRQGRPGFVLATNARVKR